MNITRTTLAGIAAAIFAIAVALHWPAVEGAFLAGMDDDEYLRQAERAGGLTWAAVKWSFTSTAPYYHPLPRLSHALDYELFGANARGHHATSVVLHALNAALAFGLLWRLLGAVETLKPGERLALAAGVAGVFAIHPLQVESVAWMSGRTQLLCTAFSLGCVWAYVAGRRGWPVWLLFALALLSKPMAVSLPVVMLILDYFPLRRVEVAGWHNVTREKAGLIAVSIAVSLATVITQSSAGGLNVPLESISPLRRVGLLLQSLTFYPWKLIWPVWLSPYYPVRLGFPVPRAPMVVGTIAVVAITALSVWRWRRTPALAAGWAAYLVSILPVTGLSPLWGQTVADRYAYVAMLPLLLLAGSAAIWLCRRGGVIARLAVGVLLAGELGYFALRAREQIRAWREDEVLWREVLRWFPDFWLAHYNLGNTLVHSGRIEEAIAHYEAALRSEPGAHWAHNNLGNTLAQAGRLPEAIRQFEEVLRIVPGSAEAHDNLAGALLKTGQLPEALEQYRAAVRLRPDWSDAHYRLGNALIQASNIVEAAHHYELALQFNPNLAEARANLAVAHNNLAWALATAGTEGVRDPGRAIQHAERACELTGRKDAGALDTLAAAYAAAGRFDEAIRTAQSAIELAADAELAADIRTRLELYKAGQPFRKAP